MKAVYSYRMTSSSAYIQGRPDLNRSLCVSNKHGFSLETYERLRFRNLSTASSSNSSSSSPLSRDDEINDKPDSEERKANFWNVFLTDAIEISGSGVPKIKRHKYTDENMGKQTTKAEVLGDGFLQRLTLIGLILSVCFLVSAIQVTHFPTVKWCLTNPRELIQNSAVSREVVRRLLAPCVRFMAAFFFARWRIRWAFGFAILSFIAPAVEFD